MKNWLILCFWLMGACSLFGQGRFEGLWEGEMTFGGLYSEQKYRFQLWLQEKGGAIKGRSYVYLQPEKVIEMEIKGSIYNDLSIYLRDITFIETVKGSFQPPFKRKYQLLFKRTIWETALEGYWQEILDTPMDDKRALGRIKLQKVKTMKP